jgi:tetratricopeptide (TPR) repeat protein
VTGATWSWAASRASPSRDPTKGRSSSTSSSSAAASSKLAPAAKALTLARIALAEARSPGDEGRAAISRDLLPQIKALRKLKALELRIALSEWAASGVEPGDDDPPEAWDALAEGTEIRGDEVKAAGFEEKAAARAERLGDKEAAAGYRLRGAGFLFQAGKYGEADVLLARVVDDPTAGASRPKAGLLQCLARGRALAAGSQGVTLRDYAEALERQVREFPDDPTATEARWLLGNVEQARGDHDKARALWTAIPTTSSRWIDARLAIVDAMRRDLESRLDTADDEELAKEFAAAQTSLTESQATARTRDEFDQVELLLREARLNLIPKLGKPRQARDALDQCNGKNLTASQRYRSRLFHTIALAALGRYVEAEREAQQHPTWADRESSLAFLDAIRLLDLCASHSETDLQQRRFGLVVRLLVEPLLQNNDDALKPEQRAELTLRLARALLFQGDPRRARDALRSWALPRGDVNDRLLRDLADLYARLEAYDLAVDVERLRIRNQNTGSLARFDARYNLALADYPLGRRREALELIERTAILHPELGGDRLHEKFVRLRQRLSAAP